MSMDVSKLAIEVTSTGIKEASTALGGLSRAAGNADKRVESLTTKLANLMRQGGSTTGVMSGLSGTMALINSAMQSASANAAALAQALAQSAQGMNKLNSATTQASGALREHSRWGGVVQATLKSMATAALAYVGVNFIGHSIKAADSWMTMTAKLKIATGSLENAKFAQQELFNMGQKLRVPVEDLTKLFARLAPTMRNNGKSFDQAKDMVEGVSLALKLNGATAGEASSVMLQFSQAMQKGRLDGAEFNAVAENGSLILRALEKQTGKSAGELKKMGSQGKLSFALVQQAIESAMPQWRKDFAELPVTVEDGLLRIRNAWFKAMGEMSVDSGLNKGLVEALSIMEKLIPVIRDELIAAFTGTLRWVNENREKLGEIWAQVKGIVGDVWDMLGAFGNVYRMVVGLGDEFSVVGFTLFSLRLAVAGLQDGFTLIGAVILKAGSYVWEGLISPLTEVVTGPLKWIVEGFTKLTGLMAKGADAVGLDSLAQSLRSASDAGDNIAQTIGTVQDGFKSVGTFMSDRANDAFNMIANGEGAVARLLAGEQQVTMEVQKRAKLQKDVWAKGTGGKPSPDTDDKAEKAAAHARKAANAELERSLQLYLRLAETNENLNKIGQERSNLTEAQKEQIKLERELALVKDVTARKILEQALANNLASQEIERVNKAKADQLKVEKEYNQSQEEAIKTATEEAIKLEDKIAGYGKVKGAVEETALAMAKLELMSLQSGGATDAQIAKQQRLVDALQRVHDATETLGQLELGDKITKQLSKLKPADFGKGFGDAFGEIGKNIDKAGKSLDQYNKKMTNLAKIRKEALDEKDDKKRAKFLEEIRKEELNASLDMYADMSNAVKGFFKEKTFAYKAFDALEKGLRIVRIAEELREFAIKQMAEKTWLGQKIASIVTAMGWDATETAASVTNSATKASASTVAGVGKAFEQMGVYGFIGAAAILAFMASMGVGGGGGAGGPPLHEERQKKQGTGTVLGDDEAKSESISNALETLRDNSNIGLVYTSGMAASLRSIDVKMGGFTASVARTPGLTTGLNFQTDLGTKSSGIQGLFGKTVTREIADTGLKIMGTLSDLTLKQYLDVIKTTKKSGFLGIGGGTKTDRSRGYQDVSDDLAENIGGIFMGISDTVAKAGASLGYSEQTIKEQLKNFSLDMEVSLKDLKGKDLEDAINAVFSAAADDMASMVIPQFKEFQRAGEGYFETLVRVASGTERAKDALHALGINMVGLADISDKTGDIDAELVRQSIIQRETGTSLAEIMRLLDGSMEDLVKSYRELTRLRNAMDTIGLGSDLSLDLIRGAGGVAELADAFDSYFDNFFTEQDRFQIGMSQLRMEFGRLGMEVPESKEAFKSLVKELMEGGAAGQELAGRVLALSGTWAETMDEIEGLQEDARDALTDAYDREAEALENTRTKMLDFASSLKEFRDNLIMGDLSTKSPLEKYQTALARYNDISAKAMAGDESAIEKYQDVANELLRYSREVNASGTAYTNDFERVLQESEAIQQAAETQADVATQSLEALKSQVEHLINIDDGVKTVAQALADLSIVMSGGSLIDQTVQDSVEGGGDVLSTSAPVTSTTTSTQPANQSAQAIAAAEARAREEALIAEVRALKAEVAALRDDQRKQTAAMIESNINATDAAADTVVDGLKPFQQRPMWDNLPLA